MGNRRKPQPDQWVVMVFENAPDDGNVIMIVPDGYISTDLTPGGFRELMKKHCVKAYLNADAKLRMQRETTETSDAE